MQLIIYRGYEKSIIRKGKKQKHICKFKTKYTTQRCLLKQSVARQKTLTHRNLTKIKDLASEKPTICVINSLISRTKTK
jgi:hypothetical protein